MENSKIERIYFNFVWALIYFILLGLLAIRTGQDMNWDLRNYHFYNPYSLLNNRLQYDVLPADAQTFVNPIIDVPFFMGIYYLNIPPIVMIFIMGGIQGINIWLIHNIVYFSLKNIRYLYRQSLSILAALTSIFGAGYLCELGGTMGDNIISIFVLSSLLILSYSLYRFKLLTWRSVLLSAIILGLGLGLKLTAISYAIGFVVAIVFVGDNLKQKILNILISVGGILGGFIVFGGYWMVKMYHNFYSPLFPLFNKIFHSPFAPIHYNAAKDNRFFPRNTLQALFFPFYFVRRKYNELVAELHFRDVRLVICYVLIVVFISFLLVKFIRRKTKSSTSFLANSEFIYILVPFFSVSYIVWQNLFSIYRYLIPLELLSTALVVVLLGYMLPSPKFLLLICLSIFIVMIVTVKPFYFERIKTDKIQTTYFGIDKQVLTKYDNSIMIISSEPYTYIVPYFPSKTRFINIKSVEKAGLFGLFTKNALWNQKIRDILQSNREKPVYLLSNRVYSEKEEFDNSYGLEVDYNECDNVLSIFEKFSICKVKKIVN